MAVQPGPPPGAGGVGGGPRGLPLPQIAGALLIIVVAFAAFLLWPKGQQQGVAVKPPTAFELLRERAQELKAELGEHRKVLAEQKKSAEGALRGVEQRQGDLARLERELFGGGAKASTPKKAARPARKPTTAARSAAPSRQAAPAARPPATAGERDDWASAQEFLR